MVNQGGEAKQSAPDHRPIRTKDVEVHRRYLCKKGPGLDRPPLDVL